MCGFTDFYRAQGDHDEIRAIVRRRAGDRLHLGIPHNCFVEVTPSEHYVELQDSDPNGLICCAEPIVVVGRVIFCDEDSGYRDLGAAFCLGLRSRVYLYDVGEDAMIMVAADLDKVARFGLLYCEILYRNPHMPRETVAPHDLVEGLLKCHDDMDALKSFCQRHHGRDVALYTPGYKYQPMKLISGKDEAARHEPLSDMDRDDVTLIWREVTARLCCRWHAFALIGVYYPATVFRIQYVLVMDAFCAIYAVDMNREKVFRIADSISMLLRGGLCKAISYGARFDRLDRGARRCEAYAICPHVTDVGEFIKTQNAYAREFRWLCRPDRFRGDMRTWDDSDKCAIEAAQHFARRDAARRGEPIDPPSPTPQQIRSRESRDVDSDSEADSESGSVSGSEKSVDYDERGFDGHALDPPRTDDGSRRFKWHQEDVSLFSAPHRGNVEMLTRYLKEKKVPLDEVELRRARERVENNYSLSFPVHIPRL